mmetsp:Transcript_23757/g.27041  ORF Transcript_23757/g.27041 Transcript_23757/m.27041 type:complete len:284 (+) Transcript_23757:253-1104(+)
MSTTSGDDGAIIASLLGYFLGFASLTLYTPIAVRVFRQKSADGLTISTWWLKLASYTCSIIYFFSKEYPISTYIDIIIISFQAAIILGLVSFFQKLIDTLNFRILILFYITWLIYGITLAPPNLVSLAQIGAAGLNTLSLLPQFYLNYKTQSKGDYSPTTAGIAAMGCIIRLYTTTQLAGNDIILLFSFGIAAILNTSLLLQILYYGTQVEKLSIQAVFAADLGTDNKQEVSRSKKKDEELLEDDSFDDDETSVEDAIDDEILVEEGITLRKRDLVMEEIEIF